MKVETRWAIFLLIELITAYGLLTGFTLNQTQDIQLHDTYFVVGNLQLTLLITFISALAYAVSFGLKKLAEYYRFFKIISIIITVLSGFFFLGLASLVVQYLTISNSVAPNLPSYGIFVMLIGLCLLFVLRTIEIWRLSDKGANLDL